MASKGRTRFDARPRTRAWIDHSLTSIYLPHHGKQNHGLTRSNRSPALHTRETLGTSSLSYWKWVTITTEGSPPPRNPPLAISVRSAGQLGRGYLVQSDCGWPHVRPPWPPFESVWSRLFVGPKRGRINNARDYPPPLPQPSTLHPSHSALPAHVSSTRQCPPCTKRQRKPRPSHDGASPSTRFQGLTTSAHRVPDIVSHDGFRHHPEPPLSRGPCGTHHTVSPSPRPRCYPRRRASQGVRLLSLNIHVNLISP